jgi:hypothetical protein
VGTSRVVRGEKGSRVGNRPTVASGGRLVIVEWDRSKGFRVSMITADVPYEDGADEIFASVIDAGRRVFEFLGKKLTDSASSVG